MAIRLQKDGQTEELADWSGRRVAQIIGGGVMVSRDEPELPTTLNGWTITEYTPADTKAAAADRARQRIGAGYGAAVAATVDASGHTWKGGEASAQALRDSVNLTEFSGGTEVLTTPLDAVPGTPVMLSIADAKAAAVAIATPAVQADINRKAKYALITSILDDPEGTIAQLDAVGW